MSEYGLRVSDTLGNHTTIVPSIASIISAGTITMPDVLNDDNTYGYNIDLPGISAINNDNIGVIVKARDFDWQSKISVVSINPAGESTTLYPLNTTHTVNTVNGYIVSESQGSTSTSLYATCEPDNLGDVIHEYTQTYYDIYVLHSDGSTTTLGTSVALDTYSNYAVNFSYEALRSATWNCPETSLLITDALIFVLHIKLKCAYRWGNTYYRTITFVTNQLGITKIEASTWTIYRYLKVISTGALAGDYCRAYVYWGNSTYDTRISNITLPVDQDYWGCFFANSAKTYYTKNNSTGVMTSWTAGNMTPGTQSTWDEILNVSPIFGWDKYGTTSTSIRIFAAISYGIYDASESTGINVYSVGIQGISEVDYVIYLKNYDGAD
jgi:hypothetical protein